MKRIKIIGIIVIMNNKIFVKYVKYKFYYEQ